MEASFAPPTASPLAAGGGGVHLAAGGGGWYAYHKYRQKAIPSEINRLVLEAEGDV